MSRVELADPNADEHRASPDDDSAGPSGPDTEPTPDVQPDTAAHLVSIPATGATYRLPDPDDPVEAHLVEANRADRAFSEQQLARLFTNLTVDAEGPAEHPAGLLEVDRDRLSRLFDMDLLDRLLDHGADPNRIVLSNWQFLGDVTNASLPGPERIHAAIAGRAASEGGRVTLTGIERTTPGLRRLAEHVGRVWRARVSIQAVIGAGAFSGQTDVLLAADHIIVPVRGLRHVRATAPDGSTLLADPIGPGQAVYLPAGASISTAAVNELFVHLEIRIERPLPLSLLPMVSDLPVAQQITWDEGDSDLRDSLLARWCATLPTRPGTPFSSMLGASTAGKFAAGWVRPSFTGGWCRLVADADRPDVLLVVAAGVCFRLPESLMPVLSHTLSGPPRHVGEALAASPAAARLIELLVVSGVLEFSPTEPTEDGWDAANTQADDHDAV